jgi:hypothetical protein
MGAVTGAGSAEPANGSPFAGSWGVGLLSERWCDGLIAQWLITRVRCGVARAVEEEEEDGMAGVQVFDFDSPDETRTAEKTRVDVVRIVGNIAGRFPFTVGSSTYTAGRFALEPGWRWSECVKPVVGTDSCQARHVGVVQSGTLRVAHEDGSEVDLRAGEAYVIEPGHDAWVIGDERVVAFEFDSRAAEEYARG